MTRTVGSLTAADIGATIALDGVHVVEGTLRQVEHRGTGVSTLWLGHMERLNFIQEATCVVEGKA